MDTVKVKFEGTVTVGVAGIMSVPKKLWEEKTEDELWSIPLERHVSQRIDGDHMDSGDFNDIEIDFISLEKD